VSQALRGLRRKGIRAARRGVFEAKTIIAEYPSLALPIARRRHGIPVGDDTRIVIEGFPRTGTSFAVAAFNLAQDGRVRIACHVHAPAQIVSGVRRRLPCLVIARDPEETSLSFVIRNPHLSIRQALRGYLHFYELLLPLRRAFVVGTFGQVTSDFGEVTRRVNRRFGTAFLQFEHTDQNVGRCFEAIDADYRRRLPEGEALEREVARPSEWRTGVKDELRSSYRASSSDALRARAERVFEAFAEAAGDR
jgi:hypothetical protein